MHPHNSDQLLAFYEERVLPALYQRLDRAFPELEWNWTGQGWKGVKRTDGGVYNRYDQTAIVCNHPWGFVTRSGTATSWLAYVNGGQMPRGVSLADAVRRLADLAGVDYTWQPAAGAYEAAEPTRQPHRDYAPSAEPIEPSSAKHFVPPIFAPPIFAPTCDAEIPLASSTPAAPQPQPENAPTYASHHQRQVQLWDAFVAFCHECLCSGQEAPRSSELLDEETEQQYAAVCAGIRKQLQQQYGIDAQRADHLPLGVYPSAAAVHEHLLACGFSQQEINTAALVSDTRLPGRVIVPWRDALGRIATIIAEDLAADDHTPARRLYIKGGQRPALFGLDVALRPASGGIDELILVDSPLDVIFFQQHGIPNAAMLAGSSKAPTQQDWEVLADLGVQNVTLALSDDSKGSARTCKSLLDACQSDSAPRVFAVPFGALETCHGAGDFARSQGVARFGGWLAKRQHAYQYLAAALVRRHRPGKQNHRTAIGGILREAMAFDAAVYNHEREAALDTHFWDEILSATRVSWKAIRPRLAHRPIAHPAAPQQAWDQEDRPRRADLDWVNGVLHTLADEQAEQFQTVWTHDPPPVRTPQPRTTERPSGHLRIGPRHVTYEDIRAKAYQLWEQKGRPQGAEQQCWHEAEQQLRYGSRTNGSRAA